jgi:hypothetical protein
MQAIEITRDVRSAPGLYTARCPRTGLVKLGRSGNVAQRLGTHRVVPFRLEPAVMLYNVGAPKELKQLEAEAFQQLHADRRREYHPTHTGSEWADLSDQDIKALFHWLVTLQLAKRASAVAREQVPVVRNVYDGISHYKTVDTPDHPPIEPGVVPRNI